MQHFGEHLMIDGYGGSFDRLNDKTLVLRCLNDLSEKLGMNKLSEPEVYFAAGNGKKDPGGWSGFVVIFESHISIHTFPEKRFLSADVYSCKNGMETDLILKFFEKAFDLKEIEQNFVKRGLRYPA